MPQISVIVPVYNVEQYLSRCLDSIINQTYRNFEVLLDGIARHNADIIIAKFQRFESKNNIKNFVIIDDWVRKLTEIIDNKNNRIVDIKSKDYDINSSCIKLQRLYCNSF